MIDSALLLFQSLLDVLSAMPWLEFAGLVSGLLCVWLLIRENIWNFPIGLVYAVISVLVFLEARLYADVVLNGYYVFMNAYGWYYWRYGGERRRASASGPDREGALTAASEAGATVRVTLASNAVRISVLAVSLAGTFVMGWLFATYTDAALPYWDSAITIFSFAAMWMTARKYIDNWVVWWFVDLLATGVYLYKGIVFYAVLYGVYLGMAVLGWRAWQRSRLLAA